MTSRYFAPTLLACGSAAIVGLALIIAQHDLSAKVHGPVPNAESLEKEGGTFRGAPTRDRISELLGSHDWETFTECLPAVDALRMLAVNPKADEASREQAVDHLKERVGFDVSPRRYAEMIDIINMQNGEPQFYGTQLTIASGRYVPPKGRDAASFNEARDVLGIESMQLYLRGENDALLQGVVINNSDSVFECGSLLEPDLAQELLIRSKSSSIARSQWSEMGFKEGTPEHAEVLKIDGDNADWIARILKGNMLTEPALGRRGLFHAFLIIQHSGNVSLIESAVNQFRQAVYAGQFPRSLYATMLDRLLVLNNKDQVYGSQGKVENERVIPSEMVDSNNVDHDRDLMMMRDLDRYYRGLNGTNG